MQAIINLFSKETDHARHSAVLTLIMCNIATAFPTVFIGGADVTALLVHDGDNFGGVVPLINMRRNWYDLLCKDLLLDR